MSINSTQLATLAPSLEQLTDPGNKINFEVKVKHLLLKGSKMGTFGDVTSARKISTLEQEFNRRGAGRLLMKKSGRLPIKELDTGLRRLEAGQEQELK